MSDEYSHASDTETSVGGFKMDAFIPLVILSISFIVLLGWQVKVTASQRTQLENMITRQQAAVTQAESVQGTVSKLATDLLEAAQTDDAAKAIVTKYRIQNNGAGAAASP